MNTWQFIHDKLSASVDVILLYVLESKGSSPGRQGFSMAVAADDSFYGTIGGGIMEYKFVEMAKARLKENPGQSELYKQVHDKSSAKNQSGMICSGEQTIFLYSVQQQDLPHIKRLLHSLQQNRNGSLQLTEDGISFSENIPEKNFYFQLRDEQRFSLTEKTGYKNRLHIIGGGHCALALSKLMSDMDFHITVYDEREGLNTMEQNNYAHEKKTIGSYEELGSMITGGDNVYTVIMTFGYRTDDLAVRALMGKQFRYIGLLGSKNKIEKMFTAYQKENMDEKSLNNIHSPIGLQIKSQTTAEIAVSIAAEIIAEKNRDQ